jgi:cytidylate kinase
MEVSMLPRSIEALVDQQARRWQLVRETRTSAAHAPVVTISHQHGAGGAEVVRRLAQELDLDVFDREIVSEIAESTHLSERVVETLDEKARAWLTDWLESLATHDFLSRSEYRYQLTRVVGAIARHGGAIIVGHGGHLVLGEGEALRVQLVAPLVARVEAVKRRSGRPEREARREVQAVEAGRRAFVMQHFHVDLEDPTRFDMILNTARLGTAGCVDAIRGALLARIDGGRDAA